MVIDGGRVCGVVSEYTRNTNEWRRRGQRYFMNGVWKNGVCEMCGREKLLSRKTYFYGIKCLCHSPEHFETVDHCVDCKPIPPSRIMVTIKPVDASDDSVDKQTGPIVSITALCNGCSDLERVAGRKPKIHSICHAEGLYIECEHNETPVGLISTPAWCPYLKIALARATRSST